MTLDSRNLSIISWSARGLCAAILAVGAIPKFTGGAGALSAVLPGGFAAVIAIGLAEVAAITLLLIPRFALHGALLAGGLMLGAVLSHVLGPVGLEGGLGGMFPMAVAAGLAALGGVLAELKRGARWSRRGALATHPPRLGDDEAH